MEPGRLHFCRFFFGGGLVDLEFGLHGAHFVGGGFEVALAGPVFVDGEKMDVGVGNVDTDDLNHGAFAEDGFQMLSELFDGGHDGIVILVTEVVDFVDFDFGDDEGVAGGFGSDVKEGKGAIVFVDFVTGNLALDDFGEYAAHESSFL